jgi:DNA replication and repair protein RecF
VRGFRNLADQHLALPPAGCVVVGPNGHGKTSLIEAVVYGQVFRSFRGAADRALVRFGEDGFRIEVALEGPWSGEVGSGAGNGGAGAGEVARSRAVACGYDARTRHKRVTVGGVPPASLAAAIGIVRGVVLGPTDVALVAGGPRERRRYLDVLLALTVPGYVEALGRYRRALAQRSRAGHHEAGAFEEVLAESGAAIVAARRAWAERYAGAYAESCSAMAERGRARLVYAPRTDGDTAALRAALEQSRARDRDLGRTSVGPHRDDLRLTLEGRDLRAYGSAGQQRTAALALRLLEARTMAVAGTAPLLCLDDAFAELDAERCACLGRVIERLATEGAQVVAAVPREDDVPAAVAALPRLRIAEGRVEAEGE